MKRDDLGLTQSPAQAAEGELSLIEDAIVDALGERCTIDGGPSDPDCLTCRTWAAFDALLAMEAEVARCQARLEIDHQFVIAPGTDDLVRVEVPFEERPDEIDGIEARDATIMLLESEIDRLRALSAEGSANAAAARLAAEEMRERAAKACEAESLKPAYREWEGGYYSGFHDAADIIRHLPLPPSFSPEDQEKAKAAATPTIADPDGEAWS